MVILPFIRISSATRYLSLVICLPGRKCERDRVSHQLEWTQWLLTYSWRIHDVLWPKNWRTFRHFLRLIRRRANFEMSFSSTSWEDMERLLWINDCDYRERRIPKESVWKLMPFFLPPKTLENLAGPLRRDRIRAFKVLQLCAYVAVFGVTLLVFVHLLGNVLPVCTQHRTAGFLL